MSGLQANTDCELFGWGGGLQSPRRDLVTILDSQFCDPNLPDVFCTTFAAETHSTCSAMLASPVVCGNMISGFLTNDGTCTTNDYNQTTLSYHSVNDFVDWIRQVTNNDPEVENNERFIVDVVQLSSVGMPVGVTFRCAGTVISFNHVLATGSCVAVPNRIKIAIQISTNQGNSTSRYFST